MIRAAFIALGIIGIGGFVLMLRNFVERPRDSSGSPTDGVGGMRREYNPELPPENDKQFYKMRKWWEW